MGAEERYLVFNERNQPVELHVDKQVIMLAARGQVEMAATQVFAPQLQGLVSRGLLSLQPVPEAAATEKSGAKKGRNVKPKTGRGRRKPK